MFELIILISLTLLCLYGAYYCCKQTVTQIIGYVRIIKSKNWYKTKGKVINAEYKFLKYSELVSGKIYRTRIDLYLKKTFTYSIYGIRYESNQGTAADSLFSRKFKSLDKLPKKRILFYMKKTRKQNNKKK